MTITTAMDLSPTEARLLNMIYRGDVNDGSNAVAVTAQAGAAVGDLVELGRERLVRIHSDGLDVDLDAIEADPGILNAFPVRVLPTGTGMRWVVDNPANSLLTHLAGSGTGQATLGNLKTHTNCEAAEGNLLGDLRDNGMIEILDVGGRDVRRLRVRLAYNDSWLIRITRAGRRRVGQI
jgi:hypothetical protein